MKTTDILTKEHQIILKNLQELNLLLSKNLHEEISGVEKKIKFIQVYADQFHHAKEENIYFPWMKSKNADLQQGPLHCMLDEHEQGRSLIKMASLKLDEYKKTGNNSALIKMKEKLLIFITLLQNHIQKEDEILYKIAEQLNDSFADGDLLMLDQFNYVELEYANSLQDFAEYIS